MFFTGKGDKGTSTLFNSNRHIPKHARVFEALGTVDELISLLGLVKVAAWKEKISIPGYDKGLSVLIHGMQHDLFTVQAELAGADKYISQNKVTEVEGLINEIELSLPEITTFLVPGGTEVSAQLDLARAVARRAERRIVETEVDGEVSVREGTLVYMNRLSSLFYALVRLVNHQSGIEEEPPMYA